MPYMRGPVGGGGGRPMTMGGPTGPMPTQAHHARYDDPCGYKRLCVALSIHLLNTLLLIHPLNTPSQHTYPIQTPYSPLRMRTTLSNTPLYSTSSSSAHIQGQSTMSHTHSNLATTRTGGASTSGGTSGVSSNGSHFLEGLPSGYVPPPDVILPPLNPEGTYESELLSSGAINTLKNDQPPPPPEKKKIKADAALVSFKPSSLSVKRPHQQVPLASRG